MDGWGCARSNGQLQPRGSLLHHSPKIKKEDAVPKRINELRDDNDVRRWMEVDLGVVSTAPRGGEMAQRGHSKSNVCAILWANERARDALFCLTFPKGGGESRADRVSCCWLLGAS